MNTTTEVPLHKENMSVPQQDVHVIHHYFAPPTSRYRPFRLLPTIPENEVYTDEYIPLVLHNRLIKMEVDEKRQIYTKIHQLTDPKQRIYDMDKYQYLLGLYVQQLDTIRDNYKQKREKVITTFYV